MLTLKKIKYTTLYTISLLLSIACYGQDQPPNVIVIMADDLGYGGLSCYGNPRVKTPHLDSLARHGIRCTDFHANAPVCTPTRASLLTGNYPQRSGLEGKALPERPLFWRYNNQKAVREGPWKLLITETDTALYNLEQDIRESNNLYASRADEAADLQRRLARWEEKVMQGVVMKTQ